MSLLSSVWILLLMVLICVSMKEAALAKLTRAAGMKQYELSA
jgi:hypothetical protein